MSFSQSKFQDLAKRMFITAGDVKINVTYKSVTEGAFNPTTDARAETTISKVVLAIVTDYDQKTIDGVNIKQTDRMVRILVEDLPGITPKLNDVIVIGSITHDVINKKVDPANAVWTIQVRA